MRSRAARMTAAAAAWIVLGATALFLFQTDRQADERGAALDAFDTGARTATAALADLRTTLQAYVAAGQGVSLWMPRAASLLDQSTSSIDALRSTAASTSAKAALMEAGATLRDRVTDAPRPASSFAARSVAACTGGA